MLECSFPNDGHTKIIIYNVTGQPVSVLKNEYHQAGKHSVIWNATDMPSGLYFCTLKVGGISETRKMGLGK
ncbi:MAG: T9SS type A sorting domain-containing protein [Candidatus Latescibacteria bacterium]|nr:T9SS type A sorting domain-containing protein [Candidatus Latescibacterota bacterium]